LNETILASKGTAMQTTASFTVGTHNGTITCSNPQTGESRTFRIKTQAADSKFAAGQRILSLLTGPDNESDYQGFAFVDSMGRVRVWRSRLGTQFEKLGRFVERLEYHQQTHGIQVQWAAKCRVCNRKLTTPESIASGIGPICGGEV
jgi:hypothetical protein